MQSFPKPLTPKEEKECLVRYQNGDMQARDILIERNLRLVAHIVKKYNHSGRDSEELISVGIVGLVKAVNTFEVDKGHKLATYAARCIENAILSQMRLWLQISPPRMVNPDPGTLRFRENGQKRMFRDSWEKYFKDIIKVQKKAGVQTLRSLFTCFLYGCRFYNCIQ